MTFKSNLNIKNSFPISSQCDGYGGLVLVDCHGLTHWERVEKNGLLLATEGVNTTVVRLFAYMHDKWRVTFNIYIF